MRPTLSCLNHPPQAIKALSCHCPEATSSLPLKPSMLSRYRYPPKPQAANNNVIPSPPPTLYLKSRQTIPLPLSSQAANLIPPTLQMPTLSRLRHQCYPTVTTNDIPSPPQSHQHYPPRSQQHYPEEAVNAIPPPLSPQVSGEGVAPWQEWRGCGPIGQKKHNPLNTASAKALLGAWTPLVQ